MTLSKEDGNLFYELLLPLLDYVNKNGDEMSNETLVIPAGIKDISDKMWDDVSIIDKYLTKHSKDIPEEHKKILRSWKRRVSGDFVLERHLKKGSILISDDYKHVYQVSGIMSSWEEMFPDISSPILMEATLIPFKDVIISDGVIMPYDIRLGHNIASQLKDVYMTARKSGLVHTTL